MWFVYGARVLLSSRGDNQELTEGDHSTDGVSRD